MKRQGQPLLILIAGIVLLGIASVFSQATQAWVARYDGPGNGIDQAAAVVVDGAGHVYVTGLSAAAETGTDFATIKYEPDGTPSPTWPDVGFGVGVRRFNGTGNTNDVPRAILVDSAQNVYVTGLAGVPTIINGGSVVITKDIATVKYDASGNQVWVALRNQAPDESGIGLALDGAGNVYVLGDVPVNYPFEGGAYVLKYSPNGTLSSSWPDTGYGVGVRRYAAFAVAFKVSGDGSVYATGYLQEGVAAPDYNIVTWHYDASGNLAWEAFYRGVGLYGVDKPKVIVLDDSGNVYVAGESRPLGGNSDYVILKYNPDGSRSPSWADVGHGLGVRRYNGPSNTNDFARSLAVDAAANVYVAGMSQRATNNIYDFITLKYDATGNLSETWPDAGWGVGTRYQFGTSLTTNSTPALAFDSAGNVVVAGRRGNDYVTFQYQAATGALGWLLTYNGPAKSTDEVSGLATDSAGNVYVTGRSVGVGSSEDFATIKYNPNFAPVANAGPDQLVAVGENCQAAITLDGTGSSDPDGDALTYTWTGSFGTATGPTAAITLGTGTNTFTLTVADSKGGTNSNTVVVAVVDATAPTVVAPAGTTTSADASGQGFIPNVLPGVGAVDNCTPTSLLNLWQSPLPGTAVGLGTHTITVNAYDAAGNRGSATTSLTVVDTTPPNVTAPAGTTASAGANGQAAIPDVLPSVVASDNCTPGNLLVKVQSPAAGTLVGLGTHTITIGVADAAGNIATAATTFTVNDTTPPTIVPPDPITVSAGSNGQAAVPNVLAALTASDNCTPANLLVKTQSPAAGTLVGLGTHTLTVTVTDAAGNSAQCVTTLTVVDTSAPVILSLAASPSVLSPASGKLVPVTLSASVTDNTDPAPRTRIISVTANEPLIAPGPQVKNPDYQITGDLTLNLRAKSSTKAGRVYTIRVESRDASGNATTATVNVAVAAGGGKQK